MYYFAITIKSVNVLLMQQIFVGLRFILWKLRSMRRASGFHLMRMMSSSNSFVLIHLCARHWLAKVN